MADATAIHGQSVSGETGDSFQRLRIYNLVMGAVHLAQVVVILILTNDFSLPITESFLAGPPGSGAFTEPEVLWDVPIGPFVALFLLISAVDHFLLALPRINGWYNANLRRGINYARWWEYAFSASVMIVLIAMLTGISDLDALIPIFAINATMIFFGLLMETFNLKTQKTNWTPYLFGCFAGAIPWVVIALSVIGSERNSPEGVPNFVYGIIISLFLLFNTFTLNMFLQYKRVGPWRDYLFGEKVYVLLSLVAKTALAWQVFTSTLID